VEYAFANPESCMPYVRAHAQEMNEDVMKKHIALYVNRFSVDLAAEGKQAVDLLFSQAQEKGLIEKIDRALMI
jgi:1,4-dihydroxy-6-naphthoate synthase